MQLGTTNTDEIDRKLIPTWERSDTGHSDLWQVVPKQVLGAGHTA